MHVTTIPLHTTHPFSAPSPGQLASIILFDQPSWNNNTFRCRLSYESERDAVICNGFSETVRLD